jgi:hypothetical protein
VLDEDCFEVGHATGSLPVPGLKLKPGPMQGEAGSE